MACARNIGLSNLPIVVVNVDGYYEPFKQMLERAYMDELIKLKPEHIVHFVPTAEDAVQWLEGQGKAKLDDLQPKLRKRQSALKRSSFMDSPSIANWFSRASSSGGDEDNSKVVIPAWTIPFVLGLTVGAMVGTRSAVRK